MKSVRLTFYLRSKKQSIIECLAKMLGGSDGATEISDHNRVSIWRFTIAGRDMSDGHQANIHDSIYISEVGRKIEIDDGRVGSISNLDLKRLLSGGLQGFVGHDGISRYWDKSQNCAVPIC